MLDEMLTLWRRHEAINRYLLAHIPEAGLAAQTLLKTGKPSTGRNVARVFWHFYEVRVSALRLAEKAYLQGAPEIGKGETPTRKEIEALLSGSSLGVEARLAAAVERGEEIRKHHPLIWLGYLIAHESHHRGQIVLALKQSGFAPPEELRWGIWEKWFRD